MAHLCLVSGKISTYENYAVVEADDIIGACKIYNERYTTENAQVGNCLSEIREDIPEGPVQDWQAVKLLLEGS